jgi:glycosyltransferase involved in cell wall biosynthesis
MQTTLAFMRDRGHEPRVIVDQGENGSYHVAGIEVIDRPSRREERALYSSADVVVTQGHSSVRSFMRAAELNKPIAFFVRDLGEWKRLPGQPQLVVFNSEWQRRTLGYSGPAIVVHPPIDAAKYLTTPGKRVTQINLNKRKGGDLFGEIVIRMPDVDFLGIVGMWEDQIVPAQIPSNLEILESRDDVREIYSQTRVLLLPSEWESFGRVAVEAGLSGIPVVASPNPGTLEALGDAAIYVDWSDVDGWVEAIRSLDDLEVYAERSAAVIQAASRFTTSDELVALEATLRDIAW